MDVQRLLETKGLDFIPSGRDFKIHCLNPDHDDSNPSMRVDNLTGIFNCFSCGFKGNLFTYYDEKANFLQIKRQSFKQKLLEKLAENIGLTLPENRVIFDKNWRGISGSTYKRFEAFEHSDKDFIGRVVFPIRGITGKITGYNARALNPEVQPKYLISPARSKFPLWPPTPSFERGHCIVVEGLFDALNLIDKGIENVVCAFGTQKLTKEKLAILKMQGATCIDIFFDGDDAGQNAAAEAKKLVESQEMTSRNVYMKNTDPGELTAQKVLKLRDTLYG